MNSKVLVIAIFVAFLTCSGCHNRNVELTPNEKISQLQQQVETDIQVLQGLDNNEFIALKKSFRCCDSLLAFVAPEQVQSYFDKLNLAQAYLQQYMQVRPGLMSKLEYSKKQLVDLQYDVENSHVNDSLFDVYFQRETIAADTLHNQVLYFKDRFISSQKELDNLK